MNNRRSGSARRTPAVSTHHGIAGGQPLRIGSAQHPWAGAKRQLKTCGLDRTDRDLETEDTGSSRTRFHRLTGDVRLNEQSRRPLGSNRCCQRAGPGWTNGPFRQEDASFLALRKPGAHRTSVLGGARAFRSLGCGGTAGLFRWANRPAGTRPADIAVGILAMRSTGGGRRVRGYRLTHERSRAETGIGIFQGRSCVAAAAKGIPSRYRQDCVLRVAFQLRPPTWTAAGGAYHITGPSANFTCWLGFIIEPQRTLECVSDAWVCAGADRWRPPLRERSASRRNLSAFAALQQGGAGRDCATVHPSGVDLNDKGCRAGARGTDTTSQPIADSAAETPGDRESSGDRDLLGRREKTLFQHPTRGALPKAWALEQPAGI